MIEKTLRNPFSGSNHEGCATERLTAVLILLASLAACSPTVLVEQNGNETAPAATAFDDTGKGWWKVYFHIQRDLTKEPEWHVDALIADQILAPVVTHTESRIALWRFHRRAGRDASGHRFSFLFYADRETAKSVNNGVARSSVANLLREDGLLLEIGLAEISAPPDFMLDATSDQGWPDSIKRSWPWFIMGVSQSWLKLIGEVRASHPVSEQASINELLDIYRSINDEVSTLWRENGQHAYLHHLNALFGYQPIIVRGSNLERF